jgi:hypothetical protein
MNRRSSASQTKTKAAHQWMSPYATGLRHAFQTRELGLPPIRLIQHGPHAAVTSWVHRNSVQSTQMPCRITANRRASNDARGMAQMMRAGLYRPVYVKTLRSQKLRMLLTHRKLQSKATAIDNDLRGMHSATWLWGLCAACKTAPTKR